MSRGARIAVVVAVLIAAALVAWWAVRDQAQARALRAITAYDQTLAVALAKLDPMLLEPYASEAEIQRVASYVTKLWGEGVSMESQLVGLDHISTKEAATGRVLRVRETWLVTRRDKDTGELLGATTRQVQVLEYTLVEKGGTLIVDRSRIIGEPKVEPVP